MMDNDDDDESFLSSSSSLIDSVSIDQQQTPSQLPHSNSTKTILKTLTSHSLLNTLSFSNDNDNDDDMMMMMILMKFILIKMKLIYFFPIQMMVFYVEYLDELIDVDDDYDDDNDDFCRHYTAFTSFTLV